MEIILIYYLGFLLQSELPHQKSLLCPKLNSHYSFFDVKDFIIYQKISNIPSIDCNKSDHTIKNPALFLTKIQTFELRIITKAELILLVIDSILIRTYDKILLKTYYNQFISDRGTDYSNNVPIYNWSHYYTLNAKSSFEIKLSIDFFILFYLSDFSCRFIWSFSYRKNKGINMMP
jgi:hypothetical protein